MKVMKMVIALAGFLFIFTACIQEEKDECITAFDCPAGFFCIDGFCIPSESSADEDSALKNDDAEKPDGSKDDGTQTKDDDDETKDSDSEKDDSSLPDIDTEQNGVCKEDTCNGFGTCEEVDGKAKCTCDEFHKGDDCSDCIPGYHMEAADDDENGDGKFSCVKNVACIPDPCNGGQCTDKDMTVTCKCLTGYAGRWCTDCDTGYLKSTVDQKCKPDCATGSYSCTGNKTCGINAVTNEAECVCAQYYSGTDCSICDATHFCSSHGTCSAPSGAPICSCTGNWTGNNCSQCLDGYVPYNGNCAKNCDPSCGQSESLFNQASHGSCDLSIGDGKCKCDPGWKNPIIMVIPMVPECSECNKSSPPPEYSTNGCPASCKTNDVYVLCGAKGDCYFEKTGSNKRYCICDSGYHLDNGDPYSGTCVQ